MSTAETIDVAELIAPISEEHPAGCELRDETAGAAVFFNAKNARDAARVAERNALQAVWAGEDEYSSADPPDWKTVRQIAVDVLSKQSKDLWIAAWLIEALLREHGFAGLRDGFRIVRCLAETYWDDIHPRPDEDGYATTAAQLSWAQRR